MSDFYEAHLDHMARGYLGMGRNTDVQAVKDAIWELVEARAENDPEMYGTLPDRIRKLAKEQPHAANRR